MINNFFNKSHSLKMGFFKKQNNFCLNFFFHKLMLSII